MASRGMTLIEILVVLGMAAALVTVAAIGSMHDFSAIESRSDRETLMDALLFARSRALRGSCSIGGCEQGAVHGVFVSGDSIIVFEGNSYAERNEDADYPFPRTGGDLHGDAEFLFPPRGAAGSARTAFSEGHPRFWITVSLDGRIEQSSREP
jgi:prepilin-type N-terminal cleavage/methylation domain-containing protein